MACGNTANLRETCEAMKAKRGQDLHQAREAFARTDIGRKWSAMSPEQWATASEKQIGLRDMEVVTAFKDQLAAIEERYAARKAECAKEGF
jgi:hypothetical protein